MRMNDDGNDDDGDEDDGGGTHVCAHVCVVVHFYACSSIEIGRCQIFSSTTFLQIFLRQCLSLSPELTMVLEERLVIFQSVFQSPPISAVLTCVPVAIFGFLCGVCNSNQNCYSYTANTYPLHSLSHHEYQFQLCICSYTIVRPT